MTLATTFAGYDDDWWTPQPWWNWIEGTFGVEHGGPGFEGFDVFDPCPSNWSPDQPSGLDIEWREPCYVNHPGSISGRAKHLWWNKALEGMAAMTDRYMCWPSPALIWCAFSIEQFRTMTPSPLELPGWVILPRTRVPFIWGGPSQEGRGRTGKPRVHGQPMKQPGRWTVFWSTVEPAEPPVESIILRT